VRTVLLKNLALTVPLNDQVSSRLSYCDGAVQFQSLSPWWSLMCMWIPCTLCVYYRAESLYGLAYLCWHYLLVLYLVCWAIRSSDRKLPINLLTYLLYSVRRSRSQDH